MLNFNDLSPIQFQQLKSELSPEEILALQYRWEFWARKNQASPPIRDTDWFGWLIIAGRGWGKTKTGAEFIRDCVESGQYKRIALIGETSADGKDVMVNGESGILAVSPPWNKPTFISSNSRGRPKLTWPCGAQATLYDAREPDQLRGPQHDLAWVDELAKFRYAEAVFDQMMMGLRLGMNPKWIATTTPRPIALLKRLINTKGVKVTRGRTTENLGNIAPTFKAAVVDRYKGTRLGRQELDAEILEDVPGALWTRRNLDENRYDVGKHGPLPTFMRIVVSVDPPATSGDTANEAGIIASGLTEEKHAFVLDDWSLQGTPDAWARKAVALYHRYMADCIVAESNNGGEMVRAVIQAVNPNVPVKLVFASRGKYVRAEPISALYEQGIVHHLGTLPELEDQMVAFTPETSIDRSRGLSPDRVDSLVWGLTELFPDVVDRERVLEGPRVPQWQPSIPSLGMLG